MQNKKLNLTAEEILLDKNIHLEYDREYVGQHVVVSKNKHPEIEEIERCVALYQAGECSHELFKDEPGWMYDVRHCALCGAGLGAI